MQVPMKQAKAQLTELVKRAEAGEEIVLTRHGQPTVRPGDQCGDGLRAGEGDLRPGCGPLGGFPL